jgi:ATP-dependent Clp protease ATP-binding subunit ClpA
MEEELKKKIIGQDEAISILCKSIRRSRAGLGDPGGRSDRFCFWGPTGVGKTELARVLAEFLFRGCQFVVRIDILQ